MLRSRLAVGVLLCVGGCAHAPSSPSPVSATEPKDSGEEITVLRRENVALRRRVQMLEDRVLRLEREPTLATEAMAPTAEPAEPAVTGQGEPAKSTPHVSPARRGARSISLGTPMPEPELEALSGYEHADDPYGIETSTQAADVGEARSYRLVGSRLVQLTQARPAEASDRPAQGPKARSIHARYDAAMTLYRDGDHAGAEQAFDAIARADPKSELADNALYWKGESAYDQAHYADALASFTEVVERYGGGNKAPDALLKIGLCYDKLGDTANAQDVLSRLVAAYPGARASDIARARLAELEVQT